MPRVNQSTPLIVKATRRLVPRIITIVQQLVIFLSKQSHNNASDQDFRRAFIITLHISFTISSPRKLLSQ
jgi:hypothetical protein